MDFMDKSRPRVAFSDLEKNRAVALVNKIRTSRNVFLAWQDGMSQSDIAKARGIGEPRVHRLLKTVSAVPESIEKTPNEVIMERMAGYLSDDEMIQTLLKWEYRPSLEDAEDPFSDVISGDWGDIVSSHISGEITDYEYAILFDNVTERRR